MTRCCGLELEILDEIRLLSIASWLLGREAPRPFLFSYRGLFTTSL